MGFFSELDYELEKLRRSRPFSTPQYAEYIIEYYRKRRQKDEATRNKDNK